ncbi:unnamed protein product [Rotaria socialis]|uniref:Uncharacterized protein n=1 Tax=Rotaria socialis TaxID=392032 RepID=A0A817WZ06_9BILA|nr:unnamed protein product [Rotaria socialis]CAF4803819.1 unnamed protein product [Rotaria socialis]
MNEIRQLCTTSSSPVKHLDEILALFHACPPQYLLPSLSLIGQSISCMSVEQLDINIVNHQLFLIIRQWSERLLQLWLINGTLNGDEHRALFYTHQLFKLLSEWLNQQDSIIIDNDNQETVKRVITDLFVDENFMNTLCRTVTQLIMNENDDQLSSVASNLSDDEDHVSPDDIHLETQTSDDQAEQADVLDALFRCVNSLVILFSHPILINNIIATNNLRSCLLDCLNSSLFIQLSTKFLRQNLTSEKIHIRSIFLLFTCLDYCTLSIEAATLQLIPLTRKVLHIWCEVPQNADDDVSPLIVRLIRLIHRLSLSYKDSIIHENLCAFLVPHFEALCLSSNVIDDIVSLLLTLSTTIQGKRHLRRLGYVQHVLYGTKRYSSLWHPLSLLITQRDLFDSSLSKRLVHLLIQRTINIFQSLTTASNDTSFDSTTPSSRNQTALTAIEWFLLLRTSFLSFTMIADELINYTKKVNLINMFIDTILSVQQDEDDSLPKLIDVMAELLWTFSLSTSTNINELLQKRFDLCRYLKTNANISTSNVRLASKAILAILELNNKTTSRSTLNYRAPMVSNNLICIFNADESQQEICLTLRDRLLIEQLYTIELITTSSCESFDSLMHLINRSSLCLFCASTQMKSDNLSHFVHQYMSLQSHTMPMLAVLAEHDCELEGSWIESLSLTDMQSIVNEIRRHLDQIEDNDVRLPSRTSDASTISQSRNMSPREARNQSSNYMTRPVPCWSPDDVSEWCDATLGSFETLQPLVVRLNGSALVHLAEILSMDPASMYHSLNNELLQRTGSSVPLTEYVSLRSELQHLLVQKQDQRLITNTANTIDNTNKSDCKKKRWKKSRLCTII